MRHRRSLCRGSRGSGSRPRMRPVGFFGIRQLQRVPAPAGLRRRVSWLLLRRLGHGRPPGPVSLVRGRSSSSIAIDSVSIGSVLAPRPAELRAIVMALVLLLFLGGALVDQVLSELGAPLVDADAMPDYLEKASFNRCQSSLPNICLPLRWSWPCTGTWSVASKPPRTGAPS